METNNTQEIKIKSRNLTEKEKRFLISYLTQQIKNDCTPQQLIMLITKVYNNKI